MGFLVGLVLTVSSPWNFFRDIVQGEPWTAISLEMKGGSPGQFSPFTFSTLPNEGVKEENWLGIVVSLTVIRVWFPEQAQLSLPISPILIRMDA